jgi:hypothetical protein
MNLIHFTKRRCGAFILLGVLTYCFVYAMAFIQLYSKDHPYIVASEWIFANVPKGSRISSPHWDDKVPVGIPGKDTAIYQMNGREYELPVYERDTPQMIEMIVRRIAASDYLTFATPRAADSIPRIPNEYPNTTALLRLLWGEKLGFSLAYATKNRPSFLGFTFNDDLADESFSVYDHPKVVVFKNEERLAPEQILERIVNVALYEPLPTMNEMLLMDRGGWVPSRSLWRPEWTSYLMALGVAVVLGLSALTLVGRGFKRLPDCGIGLCVVIGVLGTALIAWACSFLKLVPLTRSGGSFVILLVVVLALLKLLLRECTRRRIASALRSHGFGAIAAVCIGAIVVVVMRSSDATLVDPSESVEAAYLSYLVRNEDSLPVDLFQPDQRLPIAFADRFALGWLLKIIGTPMETVVNTSFVVLGAMLAGALYTVLVTILVRSRPALVGVLILIIPLVYGVHIAREATNKPIVAKVDQRNLVGNEDLAWWISREISATPVLVEACDQEQSVQVAISVRLPSFKDTTSGGRERLCSLDDPEQVFREMMALRLELFVTPSADVALSPTARSRYEKFSSRPDLFALVFDNRRLALFVPSFSRYYPRAVPS